jgi:uncharacterized membrane protein YedE/YeeE
MKTLKPSLKILASSALFWIGAAGALISFLAYYLLWSGNLTPVARLADAFHAGLYVFPILAFMLLVSLGLAIGGLMIGIGRLCRKRIEKTTTKTPEHSK